MVGSNRARKIATTAVHWENLIARMGVLRKKEGSLAAYVAYDGAARPTTVNWRS